MATNQLARGMGHKFVLPGKTNMLLGLAASMGGGAEGKRLLENRSGNAGRAPPMHSASIPATLCGNDTGMVYRAEASMKRGSSLE